MTIYATAGAKLYIGGTHDQKSTDFVATDFNSEAWTLINEVEGLGSVGDTSEAVTFTSMSDSRTRTLKGPRSAGTMEIVMGIDPADAGQAALIAAEKTPFDYGFRVVLNDAPAPRSAAVTMTIASPGVVSWNAHGLEVGDKVKFSTTGALPTGLTAGTEYFVKTVLDANTFTVAATAGGSAIATTGTQSGIHTATNVPTASERLFIAKVMSQSEQFDQANAVLKLNASLGVNSNVVRINAAG
jgi:hypothetical protein